MSPFAQLADIGISSFFFWGVLKKTIGISSKKSLKVFRQGEALVVWSKAEPWTPEKKTRGSDQPCPWPHAAIPQLEVSGAKVYVSWCAMYLLDSVARIL